MTNDVPVCSESFWPTILITMSRPPPGGKGTMTRTERAGQLCAAAGIAVASTSAIMHAVTI